MTISNASIAPLSFPGDGVTFELDVTFTFTDETDIEVIFRDANDDDAPLSLGLDYTITGDTLAGAAKVNLTAAHAAGTSVIVRLITPPRQKHDLATAQEFDSPAVERQMDDLARQIGVIKQSVSRSVLLDYLENSGPVTLPPKSKRTDTVWGFDEFGAWRLFAKADIKGDPATVDTSGPLSGLSAHDNEAAGFKYLASDQTPPLLFIRETAVAGTWSPGMPWGRGPAGDPGESLAGFGIVPGTMVIEYDSDVLPSNAYGWANWQTIGDIGTGADLESADFFDAFNNLKNSHWNAGTEVWGVDAVRVPDRRGVIPVGKSDMGGAAAVNFIQRATTLTTTISDATATPGSLSDMAVGMFILGNVNIPAGTKVLSINSGAGTIEMTNPADASASLVSTRFSILSDPEILGSKGGADVHAVIEAQLAAHLHPVNITDPGHDHSYSDSGSDNVSVNSGGGASVSTNATSGKTTGSSFTGISAATTDVGGDQAHPQLPPVLVVNYIVYLAPAQAGPTIVPLGQGDRVWTWGGVAAAAAPGDGKITINAAPGPQPPGGDILYIDDHDAAGLDLSALTLEAEAGDIITLYNLSRRGKFARWEVTEDGTHPSGYVSHANLTWKSGIDPAGFVVGDQIALANDRGGMPGVTGPAGAGNFFVQAAEPAGNDGDLWIDTDDGKFYKKIAGVWTYQNYDVTGPQGIQGVPGPVGTVQGYADVLDDTGLDPATAYEAGDTVDGETLIEGWTICRAKAGGDADNGMYLVPASGAAARHSDYDTWAEHVRKFIVIMRGTYADRVFLINALPGGTLGSTAIPIDQQYGASNETVAGLVERLTGAEVTTGTDTTRYASIAQLVALFSKITRTIRTISGTTDTLVLTDANKWIEATNGAATTITVPPNSSVAFAVGDQIDFDQNGAGQVTFAQGAGVTINSESSNKKIAAQYGAATLIKKGADTWLLVGNLAA